MPGKCHWRARTIADATRKNTNNRTKRGELCTYFKKMFFFFLKILNIFIIFDEKIASSVFLVWEYCQSPYVIIITKLSLKFFLLKLERNCLVSLFSCNHFWDFMNVYFQVVHPTSLSNECLVSNFMLFVGAEWNFFVVLKDSSIAKKIFTLN